MFAWCRKLADGDGVRTKQFRLRRRWLRPKAARFAPGLGYPVLASWPETYDECGP